MAWGICEWYGHRIEDMTPQQRKEAAKDSLSDTRTPELGRPCPFIQQLERGAPCNKAGGVCSIKPYGNDSGTAMPAATCPRRLLAPDANGRDVFDVLAEECFDLSSTDRYAVVREVPFLAKLDQHGNERGAKAGRIDWILIADPDTTTEWIAVEIQSVYFSGGNMDVDFQKYVQKPQKLNVTDTNRRPDWRSSGAKRLAPQLAAKSPVMAQWGKKIAVVVDRGFFDEFAAFQHNALDFKDSEIVWVVVQYNSKMEIDIKVERYAKLEESITAIQATGPVKQHDFESELVKQVTHDTDKVHFKIVP